MKLKFYALPALVLFTLLLSSCSKQLTPFTQELKQQHNWTPEDLRQIQFYVSKDIVLHRQLTSGSTDIVRGKIKMVDGRQVEEVIIPKGTPGILERLPDDNRMGISFEVGDQRYLMFRPNDDRGGRYYLVAADWENRIGKINYDGKQYYTSAESASAILLVDMRRVSKVQKDQRTAKGRKVQ